jgi:hypothetical protein
LATTVGQRGLSRRHALDAPRSEDSHCVVTGEPHDYHALRPQQNGRHRCHLLRVPLHRHPADPSRGRRSLRNILGGRRRDDEYDGCPRPRGSDSIYLRQVRESGVLGALNPIAAVLCLVGGSLLGLSVFRARVLDHRAGLALTVGALAAGLAAVLPHDIGRYVAVPLGLAMIWLGYSLWSLEPSAAPPAAAIPQAGLEASPSAPAPDRS